MEYIEEIRDESIVDIDVMIKQYGDSLFRMCYIYLKDRELAEDVVQETFIKVYQKYHTFNHKSDEKTWIMRIAINICKNYMRTQWFNRVFTGLSLERVSGENLETDILEREEERLLFKKVTELDIKYREVILLYYYQEMTTGEVAKVLGIKEGTVRVRLQRAREKLGVKLQEVMCDEKRI